MVCEDGAGAQHVFGVTRRREVYPMARNRQNIGTGSDPEWGEFAGVTFAPDGRTMFVNVYEPGTTFAVTGPGTAPEAGRGGAPRQSRTKARTVSTSSSGRSCSTRWPLSIST
nr:alkaline phosphatase PhoX [Actinomadura sp. J1-007]